MKSLGWIFFLSCLLCLAAGCEQKGADLEKAEGQPAADLEAGAKAKTLDEWAKANPNNGAAGSGEQGGK